MDQKRVCIFILKPIEDVEGCGNGLSSQVIEISWERNIETFQPKITRHTLYANNPQRWFYLLAGAGRKHPGGGDLVGGAR